MRRAEHNLDIPQAAGAGDPQRCDTYVDKWVGVDGAWTGTLDVEGQLLALGGWATVASVAAAAGLPAFVEVRPLFFAVRVNTTHVATGAPTAALVGLDRRTE